MLGSPALPGHRTSVAHLLTPEASSPAQASFCYWKHRLQRRIYVRIMALCDLGQEASFLCASVYFSVKWVSNARFAELHWEFRESGCRVQHLANGRYSFHPTLTCPHTCHFLSPFSSRGHTDTPPP